MPKTEASEPIQPQPTRLQKLYVWLKRYWLCVVAAALLGAVLLWAPTLYANFSTRNMRYELTKTPITAVPHKEVAIVFGAGVYENGQPSPYLQWRVQTAVDLYKAHRVTKLLLTADNSTAHYNEPLVMQKLAEQAGVPDKDIVLDYAGFSTYESCYRAHDIFQVNSAILVTQGYHMPRALVTCNALGVPSIGVNAVHPAKSWSIPYVTREWLSTDKMTLELIVKPKPTFLGAAEPIQI